MWSRSIKSTTCSIPIGPHWRRHVQSLSPFLAAWDFWVLRHHVVGPTQILSGRTCTHMSLRFVALLGSRHVSLIVPGFIGHSITVDCDCRESTVGPPIWRELRRYWRLWSVNITFLSYPPRLQFVNSYFTLLFRLSSKLRRRNTTKFSIAIIWYDLDIKLLKKKRFRY